MSHSFRALMAGLFLSGMAFAATAAPLIESNYLLVRSTCEVIGGVLLTGDQVVTPDADGHIQYPEGSIPALFECDKLFEKLQTCESKRGKFSISPSGGIYSLPVATAFECQTP